MDVLLGFLFLSAGMGLLWSGIRLLARVNRVGIGAGVPIVQSSWPRCIMVLASGMASFGWGLTRLNLPPISGAGHGLNQQQLRPQVPLSSCCKAPV